VDDDLAGWLAAAADGRLPGGAPQVSSDACVTVVMASEGYPEAPRTGRPITGIEDAAALAGVRVYHAGTAMRDGDLVSAGGRVLAVTALAADLAAARARAYEGVARIAFDGAHYRTDIAGGQLG